MMGLPEINPQAEYENEKRYNDDAIEEKVALEDLPAYIDRLNDENAALRKEISDMKTQIRDANIYKATHCVCEFDQVDNCVDRCDYHKRKDDRIATLIEAGDAIQRRLALVTSSVYDRELCEAWRKARGGE